MEITMTALATPAAASSYAGTHAMSMMTPPFAVLGGTGLPVAGIASVVAQRPRNAKLDHPPRGELR